MMSPAPIQHNMAKPHVPYAPYIWCILDSRHPPVAQLRRIRMATKTLLAMALLAAVGTSYAQQKPAVNDAQIAQIVVTANAIDIENGKIALNQSKTASVDEFANLMIKDHTAVNKNATALVTRLG